MKPDCEKYADPNCAACKGSGLLEVGGWCYCAKLNLQDEHHAKLTAYRRCRSGLCSEPCTSHDGSECEVARLLHEAQRLVQENERLRIELAAERAQRIQAEVERERFRNRLAEGRAN